MGTKEGCESYFPGYFLMRNVNDDYQNCSWLLYYGDRRFPNDKYYNDFYPMEIENTYLRYDKDVVRQTMMEHEAIFKSQLSELHRLYRKQRDLMDEIKRNDSHNKQLTVGTSLSCSTAASQLAYEVTQKWHFSRFSSFPNSVPARPLTSCIEATNSFLNSLNESSGQATSTFTSQNGACRSFKARDKLFDLQLSADKYINTEESEVCIGKDVCENSKYLTTSNFKFPSKSKIILFPVHCAKNDCHQGGEFQSKSSVDMAEFIDLIEAEEKVASHIDLVDGIPSHWNTQYHEQLLGLSKENSFNCQLTSDYEIFTNPTQQNNKHGKHVFPNIFEQGNVKSNPLSDSPHQPRRLLPSLQPIQSQFYETHEQPIALSVDENNLDCLGGIHGTEHHVNNHDLSDNSMSNNDNSGPIAAAYSILSKSKSQSVFSERLGGSLTQKSICDRIHPSKTFWKCSLPFKENFRVLGGALNNDDNSVFAPSFGVDMSDGNGLSHGPSSRIKNLTVSHPLGSHNYFNLNRIDENCMNQNFEKLQYCSNGTDLMSENGMILNDDMLSKATCIKESSSPDFEINVQRKHDRHIHLTFFPWPSAGPCSTSDSCGVQVDVNSKEMNYMHSINQMSNTYVIGNQFGQTNSPNQTSDKDENGFTFAEVVKQNTRFDSSKPKMGKLQVNRKIDGVPVLEKVIVDVNECSSAASDIVPQLSEGKVKNSGKSMVFDINLPFETEYLNLSQQQIGGETELTRSRIIVEANKNTCQSRIDLNYPITVEGLLPSVLSTSMVVKYDLEALADPENEKAPIMGGFEDKQPEECLLEEGNLNESTKLAAEIIVAISSAGIQDHMDKTMMDELEAPVTSILQWFAELVSSGGEGLQAKCGAMLRTTEEEDYFESMTLKLSETKEADYLPKLMFSFENEKIEDTGSTNSLRTQTCKALAKRGRKHRDFQRDILPGLVSLSRHEVTEDMQMFGGLMRATDQLQNLGLTRRNLPRGGWWARGRKRLPISPSPAAKNSPHTSLMQQLQNIQTAAVNRCLTGWGATRRPRRQRCPTSNLPSLSVSL